jgi:outer membrane immunogenic protein
MKTLRLASFAVAALTAAGPAIAADISPPLTKAPSFAPVPEFSWTGFYIGGNLGGGFGRSNFDGTVPVVVQGGGTETGLLGGGQIGFNYQFSDVVIGIEGDAKGAKLSGPNSPVTAPLLPIGGSASYKTDFLVDATGRLGYGAGTWLVYAKGGAAWANETYALTDSSGNVWSSSTVRPGWTAGGGVEWAFAPSWSAKVEYQYYDLDGRGTLTSLTGITSGGAVRQFVNAVTAGVNWRFWTGPGSGPTQYW